MRYFCPKCQKRHDVTDIAPDLWEIVADETFKKLEDAFHTGDDEGMIRLYYRLRRFVKDERFARRFFALPGKNIESALLNPARTETTLRGIYRISLETLLRIYAASGAHRQYEVEEGQDGNYDDDSAACANPLDVAAALSQNAEKEYVFEKEMVFYFHRAGGDREGTLVFEHLTDANGDPFTVKSDDLTAKQGKMRGFTRICPHCGTPVARVIGRAPELVVAMAGPGRSGKTACVTAILSALDSGKYSSYGLRLETVGNDEHWRERRKEITERYNKGYQVIKTANSETASSLSNSVIVCFGREKRVLTFVDMPGEFWANDKTGELDAEFFKQFSGLYMNIDFIWYFITKLSAYQYELPENEADYSDEQRKLAEMTTDKVSTISASRASVINGTFGAVSEILTANGRKMPPVAVILTKPDVDMGDGDITRQYGLFPVNARNVTSVNSDEVREILIADHRGNHRLNESKFFARNIKVRNFFKDKSNGVISAIENNCPYRTYMSVSFYGHPAARVPDADASGTNEFVEPMPPTPYRELYPLIWVMACSAAVPIVHGCSWSWKNLFGVYGKPLPGSENVMFHAGRYAYRREPERKLKDRETDLWTVETDIAANMLLEGIGGRDRINYTETAFKHKKPE